MAERTITLSESQLRDLFRALMKTYPSKDASEDELRLRGHYQDYYKRFSARAPSFQEGIEDAALESIFKVFGES